MSRAIKVFLWAVIIPAIVTADNEDQSSTVTIAQGVLRGTKKISAKGQEYLSFTGVRYGKPPTGNLRFKLPEPADKWEGIFDASEEMKCLQVRFDFMLHHVCKVFFFQLNLLSTLDDIFHGTLKPTCKVHVLSNET